MTSNGPDVRPLDPADEAVRTAVEDGFTTAVAELARLVRIPSVSWDGFDRSHVAATADAVADAVRSLELFDEVRVAQAAGPDGAPGQPAVIARRPARNGRPTVLLYAHHDVQPPGDPDLWDSSPFEPTVRGDRLYGRGASDDKAGVETHLAALRALTAAVGPDPDLGIALFLEGEEEFGSRSFPALLREHRDLLAADVIVVADSDNVSTSVPALTVSLRGNATFKLTVSTLEHAVHSGMFGGAAPDAMLAAVKLLATLWNDDGTVAVPGLETYRGTDALPYPQEEFAAEAGLLPGVQPIAGGDLNAQRWFAPAITVTGIDAPSVLNASNTLLPSVRLRVSVRVAPGQAASDAYRAVEAHLRSSAPFGARIEIDDVDLGDPFLVDTSGWAFEEVATALSDGWGNPVVHQGVGGSIPFIAELVRAFPDAQVLVTGVEDPDTRAHSPNESQHLGVLRRAILSEALLLARLERRG
ncbi:dipeptidase [Naasia sp. SYSU D00948]|uniref:dipeptidase n=1 Tax=Naasia sp. SYSU D00948 TaxID=2817379 RepID=UPI001B314322|nr:dipeptidase [Naasia sp. SYSU D00948]